MEQAELRARQLETAFQSRLVIELAKGYLVGRDGVTPDDAFASLRTYARSNHLTVHDVCQRVVDGEPLIAPPARALTPAGRPPRAGPDDRGSCPDRPSRRSFGAHIRHVRRLLTKWRLPVEGVYSALGPPQ